MHPSSLPAVPLPSLVHDLTPGASVSSSINWDRCQLRSGRSRNKCQYALGALRKPAPARMTTSNRPTARQLSLRAPLHGKKLAGERKIKQSDTYEFSRHGAATLLLCRLAPQRPPDTNRARDTLPKESRGHISFCSGLLWLTTGRKMVWEVDPRHPRTSGKAANPGRAPGQYADLQKGETWHGTLPVESLDSGPRHVLPKASARGGEGKRTAVPGQCHGSGTVLEGGGSV